tara:strand:- start:56 stop:637 length:582 start_codon:yes stop_codon:yes gene_type:complete
MSKIISLELNTKITRTSVLVKQTKESGQLYALRKFMRKQGLLNKDITIDKENMKIHVDNAGKNEIEIIVNRYRRALSDAGHGGYRIDFDVIEVREDLVNLAKQKSEGEHRAEIKKINEMRRKEQEIWSKKQHKLEKKLEHENDIKIMYREDYEKMRERNRKLNSKLRETKNELDTYRIPTPEIVWRRFKEFIA